MPKKKHKHIALFIACVALLAGGFYLYINFGSMVTRTAEKIASGALGVAVDIGSIDISLQEKRVIVNTLKIGNPPGYKNPHAITSEKILIGLNTASKDLIDFNDIKVQGSVINLEVNERGMNLVDLRDLANQKKQRESAGSEQIRVIIKHMVIEASTINPSISLLNREIAPIKMPALSFSNIGKGGGVSAGSAVTQIITKYVSAAQREAQSSGMLSGLPGGTLDEVKKTIDDAAGSLKKLFE
jgi:hypothetical protein